MKSLHTSYSSGIPAVIEHALRRGSLPGIDMGYDADISGSFNLRRRATFDGLGPILGRNRKSPASKAIDGARILPPRQAIQQHPTTP